MLFVATTGPPFCACAIGVGGTSVAELVMEDREVEDEDAYAVDPESWEDRELWLMVWLRVGYGPPALRELNTGAVFVRERDPWV